MYSWINVCSVDWVRDLKRHYNIVTKKSLILQPPNITDELLVWSYIRGYFDGDGHASKSGTSISLVTASKDFSEWLISCCGTPGHIQHLSWEVEEEEGVVTHSARNMWFTGESARKLSQMMYKYSTPETRLDRKYQRLKKFL